MRLGIHLFAVVVLLPPMLFAQITVSGVADKSTYNNTATLTVTTQAGYDYEATLNWKPIATGVPVLVNKPDFYELRVNATNQANSTVTSLYRRFIVLATERAGTEWGLPPHVPFPAIQSSPSEFAGAHLRLIIPASFPPGYPIPIVAWAVDDREHAVRGNGLLKNSGTTLFQMKRGVGSGFVTPTGAESLDLNLEMGGLATNATVALETNVVWTMVSGVLNGNTVWTNNARIHVVGNITIPSGSSLTIEAGTIARLNSRVDITNNGTVTISGTLTNPVVFMPATNGQPWGGFIQHANNTALTAVGAIFTGSGAESCFFGGHGRTCGTSGIDSHLGEQGLFSARGANCNVMMTDSAAIKLAGQLGHGVGNGGTVQITLTRFLLQGATSGGEYTRSSLIVNDSALIEFPEDSAGFVNEDHDALYLNDGSHFFTNTLFGWTKDDGIDSGGSGAGPLTYQSCWFESTFHEGNSLSGFKNVLTRDTVYFDCGQGIEGGYDSPTSRVDHCFFSMCKSGIRHGDNYDTFSEYTGPMIATNNISIYNHRDLFGFNWDNSGGWTNNYRYFFASNNLVSVLDTNYPSNTLWDPVTDAWRLGAFGGVCRVGVGFGARGSLAQLADGIPVGLSRFCTNEVSVDYVIDGTDGTHLTGTLVFPAGLTRRVIPRPSNTNGVWRMALMNAVNADVTGGRLYFGNLTASNPPSTLLVASNAVWKYFDQTNDLGTAWRGLDYNDTSWLSGAAQLGFGENDQATTIASNRQTTTYFRRVFTVADAAFANLSLMLLRDDAGVVFLNDKEVHRSPNLPVPPSVITNRTPATSTGENTIENVTISATNLVAGTNVVAVEIHQESLTSSDVSFALSLSGNPLTRPQMALVRLGDELVIYSSDNTAVIEEASDVTGPWTPVPNVNTPTGFVPLSGQRFFRLRK
jgi:hypothetical protein